MSTKQTVLIRTYRDPSNPDDPEMASHVVVTSDHEEAIVEVDEGCAILGAPALREFAKALIYCADRIDGSLYRHANERDELQGRIDRFLAMVRSRCPVSLDPKDPTWLLPEECAAWLKPAARDGEAR